MVDIARDPRWGRIVEGAGEDPHLGSVMAVAQVRGFQGERLDSSGALLAGPKHFAGYGASLGGRDYDEVNLSDHELHNVYLPPFRAAVEAGAGNLMTAYMPLNGVPATANRWLLTEVLRDDWGFDGFLVSDANAAVNLTVHRLTADPVDAAARALNAGLDLEMSTGTAAYAHLPEAVAEGRVSEAVLDAAVLRILRAKLRLRIFEQPFVDEDEAERVLGEPAHRELAHEAAVRSAVLLRNESAVLPLRGVGRIALLGPLAASARDQLGPWVFEPDLKETVTLAEGLRAAAEAEGIAFDHAPGVRMPARPIPWPFGLMHENDDEADWANFDAAAGLSQAVALAAAATWRWWCWASAMT
jgi:beta-glucosidase